MLAVDINPKNNPAYSPRLYRWLKRRSKSQSLFLRTDPAFSVYNSIYIGELHTDNYFTGHRVATICALAASTGMGIAMFNCKGHFEPRPDIEAEYLRIGRCALDPEHHIPFQGDRWQVSADQLTRTCLWCGVVQEKKTVMVPSTSWQMRK